MKYFVLAIFIFGVFRLGFTQDAFLKSQHTRPRIVISSDFPPLDVCMSDCAADHTSDPDDVQSMVRFLLYANEFDIEGLIASSGTFANVANKQNILDIIDLYARVYDNLVAHDSLYPTPDFLRSVTYQGRSGTWGGSVSNNIGDSKDSEASDSIISIVDRPDPRPVWFCFWGDCSNLAQAIWKVKNTRSDSALQVFLSKIRIYQIAHQDSTIDWMLNNFPNLFIIYSRSTYQGMFGGSSDSLGNLSWLNTHIRQNHGPLGAVYPPAAMGVDGLKEGDTPSFLYLVSAAHGMNDPEDPSQESWGGQYVRVDSTNHWVDGPGQSSISRWKSQYQAEFAERADWMMPRSTGVKTSFKPRIIVLTDISTWETDDHESLTRLLAHADLFEIEGIIFTTGWSWDDISSSWSTNTGLAIIDTVINAYEKDLPNLMLHSNQTGFSQDTTRQEIGYWPSADYLRKRVMLGSLKRGMKYIGAGNNSDGSNLIIVQADENDDRPIWITFWGSGNTLAQAIWQVQQSRSEADLKTFLHKLRAYAITDQDRSYDGSEGYEISSQQWLRREFADDLFYIWDECAWKYQNGTGRNNWSQYETDIQGHGNLGNQYPKYKNGVEGDTPSFLYLLPNGLNDPNDPAQCSWGGYSVWSIGPDKVTYAYNNYTGTAYSTCNKYENHFYAATFNNFAARMDWAKSGSGNRNPEVVFEGDSSLNVLTITPRPDSIVVLDASGTFDPDGDSLTFNWWIQPEAGTYSKNVTITNSNSSIATVQVPSDSDGKTFHIICEVTDNGTPNLTSYRRIIFKPSITGTNITVNQIPVAYAGPDQTVKISNGDSVGIVKLDGSGSNDFDGSIISYIWSENGNEITDGPIASLDMSAGEHIITLTVTDDKGAADTDEVIISVIDMNSTDADIWLEAECGTIGSLWNINSDVSASDSEYITIQPGNNSTDNPPSNDNGLATYNFSISESGTYKLWTRVIAPSTNDDSYWLRMDNGDWFLWNNITSSSSWTWASGQSYSLNSGAHSLKVGYCEDGTKLDKLYLTKSGSTPAGEGETAGNCIDTTGGSTGVYSISELKNIVVYPNPANDVLYVSFPDPEEMNSALSIYDSNGKLIKDISTFKNVNSINISGIHPGEYFLVVDNNNKQICKKFIIK